MATTDFFSVEVWTPKWLSAYFMLFVIDLKSRRVLLAGITTTPNESFMAQVGRSLNDAADGFLRNSRVLICDRGGKLTEQYKRVLDNVRVRVSLTPRQAPNCNAFAERFVLVIKSECSCRMILFQEWSLRRAISELTAHHNRERAHQEIGSNRIEQGRAVGRGDVICEERLGGLLKCCRPAE